MLTWWFIIGVSIQVAWTITELTVLKVITITDVINMLKTADNLVRFIFFRQLIVGSIINIVIWPVALVYDVIIILKLQAKKERL